MKIELRKDCDGCGEDRIIVSMSADEAEMLRDDLPHPDSLATGDFPPSPMLALFYKRLESVLHESDASAARA
jgi:hypothetical protein